MLAGWTWKRPQTLTVLFLVIFTSLYYSYGPSPLPSMKQWQVMSTFTKPSNSVPPIELPPFPKSQPTGSGRTCSSLPGAQDILIILKTNSSEARDRLPMHLNTTARCVPHFLIFSDLEETIDGYIVHDALDTIPDPVREANAEFRLYDEMQAYKREGRQDYYKLIQADAGKIDRVFEKLDRWKMLPMLDKAQDALPEAKWYLFMEADTALVWWNLLPWLNTFDSNEPFYLGNQANFGEIEVALSGASYILSNRALHMATDALREDPRKYDRVQEDCCGDLVLAKVMKDLDVHVTHSWPTLQGETFSSLDYSRGHWCSPVISYHQMSPHEVNALWKFEQSWAFEQKNSDRAPLLHRDVFNHFIWPYIQHERSHWDNLSGDLVLSAANQGDDEGGKQAAKSMEACRSFCQDHAECVQYSYRTKLKTCSVSYVARFGKAAHKGDTDVHSGWLPERIDVFRKDMEPCARPWITPDNPVVPDNPGILDNPIDE